MAPPPAQFSPILAFSIAATEGNGGYNEEDTWILPTVISVSVVIFLLGLAFALWVCRRGVRGVGERVRRASRSHLHHVPPPPPPPMHIVSLSPPESTLGPPSRLPSDHSSPSSPSSSGPEVVIRGPRRRSSTAASHSTHPTLSDSRTPSAPSTRQVRGNSLISTSSTLELYHSPQIQRYIAMSPELDTHFQYP